MLNKDLQMELLQHLFENFGSSINTEKFEYFREKYGDDELSSNLQYLTATGLIEGGFVPSLRGSGTYNISSIKITADGADHIDHDSIGNQVKAVTIKVHSSTLEHLEDIIKNAGLSKEEEKTLLKRLSEKGAEHFLGSLIDSAVTKAPVALAMLQTLLGN